MEIWAESKARREAEGRPCKQAAWRKLAKTRVTVSETHYNLWEGKLGRGFLAMEGHEKDVS